MTEITPVNSLAFEEVIDVLSKRFGVKLQIREIDQLSEPSKRNILLRLYLENLSKEIPESLIFKQACLESSETNEEACARFGRDWA